MNIKDESFWCPQTRNNIGKVKWIKSSIFRFSISEWAGRAKWSRLFATKQTTAPEPAPSPCPRSEVFIFHALAWCLFGFIDEITVNFRLGKSQFDANTQFADGIKDIFQFFREKTRPTTPPFSASWSARWGFLRLFKNAFLLSAHQKKIIPINNHYMYCLDLTRRVWSCRSPAACPVRWRASPSSSPMTTTASCWRPSPRWLSSPAAADRGRADLRFIL